MPDDPRNDIRPVTALLTANDARTPASWSGIPYHMADALERHLGEIVCLGPLPRWPGRLLTAGARARSYFDDRRSLPKHSHHLSRFYARAARARLAALETKPDLVFSPIGSVLLANLETHLPVVYSSDATTRLMFDYYPSFTGLSERARRAADDLEQRTIARADLLLYPTHWAAESAVTHYGADPGRIRVLPYGANLSETPSPSPPGDHERDVCRLLMVGVDWTIKGGAIAVETLRALQARGIAAELTVVGRAPAEPVTAPGLTFAGFLDKNLPEHRARLDELYARANFFILPSRCECFGIVFCEAAAHGLPAIASRTGGIPEVVREGETGYTLPLTAGGDAYAARIADIWADRPGYQALRRQSRLAFETRLNWDAWGRDAATAIREMLAAR